MRRSQGHLQHAAPASGGPLGPAAFFHTYALFKRGLYLARGRRTGDTRYVGWLPGVTPGPT
ncbi:hypothetical protein ACN28S_43450 [Cystobacter fuscus]